MQQIHGKLNIDKVDETMYVIYFANSMSKIADTGIPGRNFENSMHWVRKLPMPLPALLSASLSTRQNWMMSWPSLSKNNWITRC